MKYKLLVAILIAFLVTPVMAGSVDPLLNDRQYLNKEKYILSDNMVPVIIQMNVPSDIKITDRYKVSKNAIVSTLKLSGKKYSIGHDLQIVGSFAAKVDYNFISTLAANPNIAKIHLDKRGHGALQDAVVQSQADDAWTYQSNNIYFKGTGIKVAVIDGGIEDPSNSITSYKVHPDLGSCIGPTCKVTYAWSYVNNNNTSKGGFHGIAVAGIIAADGKIKGVAPETTLVSFQVCNDQNECDESNTIAAIQRSYDPNEDGNSEDKVDIIDLSLENFTLLINTAVANITSYNITVVAAVGNAGPNSGTVSNPGAAEKAITVGAIDKNNYIASFSARGPTIDGKVKPDVVSYGVLVNTTSIWTTASSCNGATSSTGCYKARNGTSFSTPMVTGIAALVKQKHPTWTPQQIKDKIMISAVDLGYENNTQGAGRADALYAIDDLPPSATNSINNGAQYATSNNVNVAWTCADSNDTANPSTGTKKVQISNDGTTWTTQNNNSSSGTISWELTSGEGETTVHFKCIDKGGNPSAVVTDTIIVDSLKPSTSVSTQPTNPNSNGWFNQNVNVTLTCSDGSGSGCNITQYCIGAGCTNWQTYSGMFTITTEQNNTLRYRSRDNAYNIETEKTHYIAIDKTAPDATNNYPSNGTWNNTATSITVSGSDSTSGVQSLQACEGSGCEYETQTNPYTHSFNGVFYNTVFNYRVTDRAGFTTTKSLIVMIDKGTPTTTPSNSGGTIGNGGWFRAGPVTVTLLCNDASQSGCHSTYYNDVILPSAPGAYTLYASPFAVNGDGSHSITFYSKDLAMNTEDTRTHLVHIDSVNPDMNYSQSPASPDGQNGWYTQNVTVEITCNDATSKCHSETESDGGVWYKLNDNNYEFTPATTTPFTKQIIITAGEHTLKYKVQDAAGNNGTENTTSYKVDLVIPEVNITSPEGSGLYTNEAGTDLAIPTGLLTSIIQDPVTIGKVKVKSQIIAGGYSTLDKVELLVDGVSIGTMTQTGNPAPKTYTYEGTFNSNLVSTKKSYVIGVKATNIAGMSNTDTVTITSIGTQI